MSKPVEIRTVVGCSDCPFFENQLNLPKNQGMYCNVDEDTRIIPSDAYDETITPDWCPLNKVIFQIEKAE